MNKVYYNPKSGNKILSLVKECKKKGVPVYPKNISGIEGEISPIEYFEFDRILERALKNQSPIVILDRLKDPSNLGSIVRTSEFFGCAGVVISKRRCVSVTETVIKVSTGAIFHIPIAREENLVNCIKKLKNSGIHVIGVEVGGRDIGEIDLTPPVAFVFGEEDRGLSNPIKKHCDEIAGIKGFGKVGSLNVSTAVAIVLFESSKNRKPYNNKQEKGQKR